MIRWYIVPTEVVGYMRAPKYFASRVNNQTGIVCTWKNLYYGKLNTVIVLALDISLTDDIFLVTQSDVYAFPLNIDPVISDKAVLDNFLEPLYLPTDWITASSTYRELLHRLYSMFAFSNRYEIISGGQALLGDTIDLSTRYRQLTTQQQAWFDAVILSFGWNPTIINVNSV